MFVFISGFMASAMAILTVYTFNAGEALTGGIYTTCTILWLIILGINLHTRRERKQITAAVEALIASIQYNKEGAN